MKSKLPPKRRVVRSKLAPQGLAKGLATASVLGALKKVQALVLDVDGVLTDGSLFYSAHGEALKQFSVRDGHGLVSLRLAGIKYAVLSARRSDAVAARAQELQFTEIMQGEKKKTQAIQVMAETLGLPLSALAYMGDDTNDLGALARVGFSAAPADAASEVLKAVHWVSSAQGGNGAVREICELILKAQGRWDEILALMNG